MWQKLAIVTTWTVVTMAVWWMLPTSTDGLGEHIPKPRALAKEKRWGCGFMTDTKASSTHFYEKVKMDDKLRKQVHSEMIARGYRHRRIADGDTYTRRSNGFTSSLRIYPNGTIAAGASRRKWPLP